MNIVTNFKMKKLYIILGVISALTKWSVCTGEYGFDDETANGSVDFCASLNPQNQLDISKVVNTLMCKNVLVGDSCC